MGSEGDSKLDTVVNSIVVLIVGTVMLCSAAIPLVSAQIGGLSNLENVPEALDILSIQNLMVVALIFAILGLVIGIVKMYTARSDR